MIKEICFANEIIIFARYTLMNKEDIMLAYTYIKHGKFELQEKARPEIKDSRDAIVRVTLGSICTSDLHIKHGSVPRVCQWLCGTAPALVHFIGVVSCNVSLSCGVLFLLSSAALRL